MRREADKLLRDHLARQFNEQRRRIADLQVQLVSSGQIALVDDLQRAVTSVQTLADRLRTASYGYAGFFDAVKVKEEELDALYAFDNALVSQVAAVAAGVDKLASAITAKEGVAEAIAELTRIATEANETFGQRQEVILSLGDSV